MKNAVAELPADATPADILISGIEAAAGPVSLACSFSLEDVIIIDIARKSGLPLVTQAYAPRSRLNPMTSVWTR